MLPACALTLTLSPELAPPAASLRSLRPPPALSVPSGITRGSPLALTPPRLLGVAAPVEPQAAPAEPPSYREWSRSLPVVTVGLLGAQVLTLSILAQLPPETTGWGEGAFDLIVTHDLEGPHWDNDRWGWNYIAHPIVGSEYYLLARNRDVPWWGSAAYSFAMSTFWEYFTEAYYERPSAQDLFITPIAGSLIGELRFQAKRLLRGPSGEPDRAWKTILLVVLDPVDALSGGL